MTIYTPKQSYGNTVYGAVIPLTARTLTSDPSVSVASTPRTMDIVHGPYSYYDSHAGATVSFDEWPCWPDWRYCAYTVRYRYQDGANFPQQESKSHAVISSWTSTKDPVITGFGAQVGYSTDETHPGRGDGWVCPCPPPMYNTGSGSGTYTYNDLWTGDNCDKAWNHRQYGTRYNYTDNGRYFYKGAPAGTHEKYLEFSNQAHNVFDTVANGFSPLYFSRMNGAWNANPSSGSAWSNSILGAKQLYFPEHWMIFSTSSQIDPRCFSLGMDVMYSPTASDSLYDFGQVGGTIPTGAWRGHSSLKVGTTDGIVRSNVYFRTRQSSTTWSAGTSLISNRGLGNAGAKYCYLGKFGSEYFHIIMNLIETGYTNTMAEHLGLLKSGYSNLPDPLMYQYVSPPILEFYYDKDLDSGNSALPMNCGISIWEWGVNFWGEGKYGGWNAPTSSHEYRGWRRKVVDS